MTQNYGINNSFQVKQTYVQLQDNNLDKIDKQNADAYKFFEECDINKDG